MSKELDYNSIMENFLNLLNGDELINKINALSMIQNIEPAKVIERGYVTHITYETLPNYKNYAYIINKHIAVSGITGARMEKGVKSKRNYIESQINKLLKLYKLEDISQNLLEMSINLSLLTFDSVIKKSGNKVKENYKKAINDIEFLYINLKLSLKILAETLRENNQDLGNMTLQYVIDALKKEKDNIAQTFIKAYISNDDNKIKEAKDNYREWIQTTLNNYYKKIKYNHEHATMIGEENQIVKVLGNEFFDTMSSFLLYNIQTSIVKKYRNPQLKLF
jgi:hypothetical protein